LSGEDPNIIGAFKRIRPSSSRVFESEGCTMSRDSRAYRGTRTRAR
jgi:hypothetical protein